MRVVKVGGSLLDYPLLITELCRWLALQTPGATLFVVGGGALADAIRVVDRTHGLDAEEAHWLAIGAMSRNARWLIERLPHAAWVTNIAAARSLPASAGLGVLDAYSFLRTTERSSDRLPADWSVTSDSLAARVAHVVNARELVLFKSRLPAEPADVSAAAAEGYVDAWFSRAANNLARVRCVNLRDPQFPQATFRGGPGG
jgi:5-(aminomethyl)-3-furanmethanol phosphate kinase